jgi:hypothetical protein
MESMNLLDVTIKYFNLIVFVLCVFFGMISFFASWVAWRAMLHTRNVTRGVIAAYNIIEDTFEKGRTPTGDLELDPSIVQTVFNSLQEILNAIYGDVTGRPIPPKEERGHGARKAGKLAPTRGDMPAKDPQAELRIDAAAPPLIPGERDRHHGVSQL